MAGLMLSRHHSLFLESLPAGCARGHASCVHRESSVSPQHALPRAAGGLLRVKLLITRSIKLNNVPLLLKAAFLLWLSLFLQCHFVAVYHSADALAPPTPLRSTALLRDRRFAVDALVLHGRVVYNNVLH